ERTACRHSALNARGPGGPPARARLSGGGLVCAEDLLRRLWLKWPRPDAEGGDRGQEDDPDRQQERDPGRIDERVREHLVGDRLDRCRYAGPGLPGADLEAVLGDAVECVDKAPLI